MADGDYERRGGREAELKHFHEILEQMKKSAAKSAPTDHSSQDSK